MASPLGRVGELADDELGKQLLRVPDPVGRVLLPQLVDLPQPLGVSGGLHLPGQRVEDPLGIAHDGDGHPHVLAHLGWVDVDVDDLGVGREVAEAARHPVVEAHAHGDQQVGAVDGVVVEGHAVHPRHAHAEDVPFVEGAEAQQCGDDGSLGLLRQLLELGVGPGDNHAVASQDQRALRFLESAGLPA